MPIDVDYQAGAVRRRWTEGDYYALLIKAMIVYLVVSMATLPFIDTLWLGEVPLLALPQVPKTELANWLRRHVVMPAIKGMGVSRGSFSPDWGLARPYALAAAYLMALGPGLIIVWVRARAVGQRRVWVWVVVLAAVVDFFCTLWFGGGPGLTIY
jgi:hypothetical protein